MTDTHAAHCLHADCPWTADTADADSDARSPAGKHTKTTGHPTIASMRREATP